MKYEKGFSLLELMIVMMIILVISTLAFPYLTNVRRSANESSAVAALRSIASAELAYSARNNQTYAGSLSTLVTGAYLDQRFSSPASLNGYGFSTGNTVGASIPSTIPTSPPDGFSYSAQPNGPLQGLYNYAVATDGVIYYGSSAPAGLMGTPVR